MTHRWSSAIAVLVVLDTGCQTPPIEPVDGSNATDAAAAADVTGNPHDSALADAARVDVLADAGPGDRARDDLAGPATCVPLQQPQPNAGLAEAPGVGGCLPGMLAVDTFCIDQYEATLLVVNSDGSTSPWSPYFNPGGQRVRAASLAGGVPQGYLSGQQAQAACSEAGKRLCSDAEWLRACRGPDSLTYPYGDVRQPGVCNDSRSAHPVIEIYGATATFSHDEMINPCLNQLADSLDPAGANVGCATAEGVDDMMGNLHEWTADPAGTFRGGFYVDTVVNGPGCLYVTTAHTFDYFDYSTGFRCCADR